MISVVLPCYNEESAILECVNSIKKDISKSEFEYEIIIVDDGSTDGTGDWVSAKYPSVKYIYQKNSGVSSARNNAIRNTRGEWIAFLDSDDLWELDKLEKQIKVK